MKNTSAPKLSVGFISWIILLFLGIVWGSSYVLIKKGLVAFNPVQLACLRVSLSGLAFLPMYIIYRKKVDWSKWRSLLIVGLSGTFIPAFLFALAQTKLSSSVTGVLGSLTPLNTVLIAVLFFGLRAKRNEWIGVLLGLIGALVLVVFGTELSIKGSIWSGLLVFIATACYALSSNTVKAKLQDMNALALSSAAFLLIVPIAIALLPVVGIQDVMSTHPEAWKALGYITLLSLGGTVLASILFFYLVQITNPIFASTVSYLIPMIAMFWGRLDGELINITQIGGMCIILIGVYLTRQK